MNARNRMIGPGLARREATMLRLAVRSVKISGPTQLRLNNLEIRLLIAPG
jgi:hypothetical protein